MNIRKKKKQEKFNHAEKNHLGMRIIGMERTQECIIYRLENEQEIRVNFE